MDTPENYKIVKELFNGPRVRVLKAIDEHENPVILKILHAEHPTFAEITRFRLEYEIASSINAREIVPVLELKKFGTGYVLARKDIGGIPLNEFRNGNRLRIDEFLVLAIHLTESLQFLHSQNIIHRDLKPHNILIIPESLDVYIIDLGLASRLGAEEQDPIQPENIEGTLSYMSPEQTGRMNRTVDHRSDLYSVGITFYELLTGILPFQSQDPLELVHAHLAFIPESVSNVIHDIPKSISDMVTKLLSKTPEDRYQSATGLLEDLKNAKYLYDNGHLIEFTPGEREKKSYFSIPQKLYGREAEVLYLLDAFENISSLPKKIDSEGSTKTTGGVVLVLVAGHSGVGKTVLINEIHKPIFEKRGYFITGRFDQFQRDIPYNSFIQAFQSLIKQILLKKDEDLDNWKNIILTKCGADISLILDVIPELIHITGDQYQSVKLPLSDALERFHEVFKKFVSIFASSNHPLTIFLDDIQWADTSTLKLIETLITDTEAHHLLIIGAYRDNEVDSVHPIRSTVSKLESLNLDIRKIFLSSLGEFFVGRLIEDTLHRENVGDLTELVFQKTGGNPFFVKYFLESLYKDRSIKYNDESGWIYDIGAIKEKGYTDNMVDTITNRITFLSEDSQQILKFASCIGTVFDLPTLSLISGKSIKDTALSLKESLLERIIIPLNDSYRIMESLEKVELDNLSENLYRITYKFNHDRIHHAIYSFMDESLRIETHVQIGKILWQKDKKETSQDKIFEMINHLNFGIDLPWSESESVELSELNLLAGNRARDALSFNLAIDYYMNGITFIRNLSENEKTELLFKLYLNMAECQYSTADFFEAILSCKQSFQYAKNRKEQTTAYKCLISIYLMENNTQIAIKYGLECLKLYDIQIQMNSLKSVLFTELKPLLYKIKTIHSDEIINLHKIKDEDYIALLEVMHFISASSYISNPILSSLINIYGVKISLEYGNSPYSASIFANFGGLLSLMGKFKEGMEYCTLAFRLANDSGLPKIKSAVLHSFNLSTSHWNQHAKMGLKIARDCFDNSIDSGEKIYAGYSIILSNLIKSHIGYNLNKHLQDIEDDYKLFNKIKYKYGIHILNIIRYYNARLAGNEEILSINNEDDLINSIKKVNSSQLLSHILLTKKLFYMYLMCNNDDYDKYISDCRILSNASGAQFNIADELFITSLLYLRNINESNREKVLSIVSKNLIQFKKWAKNCPENYKHKYLLIEAEYAKFSSDFLKVIDLYENSIKSAIENDYIQNAALALEQAARYCLTVNREKFAKIYIKDAIYYYGLWGASEKVLKLQNEFSIISNDERITSSSFTSSHSNEDLLDLQSILKSTIAISSEIISVNILKKLMEILIENTGAQRSVLLEVEDNDLLVNVEISILDKKANFFKNLNLSNYEDIPKNIINYVRRTGYPIEISNASEDNRYSEDTYITNKTIKSILCIPIQSKGKIMNILYLENNLLSGVFTRSRQELVQLIASQAAFSIENAKLYEKLEEKVQSRTQELEKTIEELRTTQEQLIEIEKNAALGKLIKGVTVELINPISSIRAAQESFGKLNTSMLENLPEFFQSLATGEVIVFRKLIQVSLRELRYRSTKEEREIKKEIRKELLSLSDRINENDREYFEEYLSELCLPGISEVLIETFGIERAKKVLINASLFISQEKTKNIILSSVEKTSKVIYALRRYLKSDIGTTPRSFDIKEEIEKAINLYENITSGNIEVDLNLQDGQIYYGSTDDFFQVWRNLFYNSIQAVQFCESKKVNISSKIVQLNSIKMIEIIFSDSGIGITEDNKTKIFKPFYTTRASGDGIGLGLYISKMIIEEYGGNLNFTSSPGQTEFIVHLPLQDKISNQ